MKQISECVYQFEDTCLVYLIKEQDKAVLIDFGSGRVLDHLDECGVMEVTDILITHHHRDQVQGLAKAVQAGIRIWVPHMEQDLIASIDQHWQERALWNNYNMRQDRYSLLTSVAITGVLHDYDSFQFGSIQFEILPTPGHTVGSISLRAHLDGQTIVFSGDLIAGPGKLWSLQATQWSYNGAEGLPLGIASLLDLKRRGVDVLLPSHGEIMHNPMEAIDQLVANSWAFMQSRPQNGNLFQLIEQPFKEITPHFLMNRACIAHDYVLLSDSGKALFFDFGYDLNISMAAGTDRASRRPWVYTLPTLKAQYGVTKVDAVVPTHYHDDHIAGINLIRRVEGSEVWAADNFADVLVNPDRYDLPCLWYDPVPVDRVLPLDTFIEWEEHKFRLHAQPGHTKYAVAIELEVDGQTIVIQGDQYQENDLHWNYVYQNKTSIEDYRQTSELYHRIKPDIIVGGHWNPVYVKERHYDILVEKGESLIEHHITLLPEEQIMWDAKGEGVVMTPHRVELTGGEKEEMSWQVQLTNPYDFACSLSAKLVSSEPWCEDQPAVELPMGPYEKVQFTVSTPLPKHIYVRRARFCVDVTIGEKHIGQVGESFVTIE